MRSTTKAHMSYKVWILPTSTWSNYMQDDLRECEGESVILEMWASYTVSFTEPNRPRGVGPGALAKVVMAGGLLFYNN